MKDGVGARWGQTDGAWGQGRIGIKDCQIFRPVAGCQGRLISQLWYVMGAVVVSVASVAVLLFGSIGRSVSSCTSGIFMHFSPAHYQHSKVFQNTFLFRVFAGKCTGCTEPQHSIAWLGSQRQKIDFGTELTMYTTAVDLSQVLEQQREEERERERDREGEGEEREGERESARRLPVARSSSYVGDVLLLSSICFSFRTLETLG